MCGFNKVNILFENKIFDKSSLIESVSIKAKWPGKIWPVYDQSGNIFESSFKVIIITFSNNRLQVIL